MITRRSLSAFGSHLVPAVLTLPLPPWVERRRPGTGANIITGIEGHRGRIDSHGRLDSVRILLNLIWLVFSGFWLALGYLFAGVVMCVLIITIPFGIASFRLAAFVLWPFGRTVVQRPDAGAATTFGNVLWFVLVGLWMAIAHLIVGVLWCFTIIGIPLGVGNFKLAAVAVAPLGKEIVPTSDPRARLGTVSF
jgi:uncharacterized membrane protein YccF (DUF307 family)